MQPRQYIAIDLKSFYASVECVERGLDPLDTCLVVADMSRTEKTICLAVSPALKGYGTGGRPRLFEVVQKVREANYRRGRQGKSYSKAVLDSHPEIAVDKMMEIAESVGVDKIALPAIGAGLGGLLWVDVKQTLEKVAAQHISVDLYVVENYCKS